MSINFQCGSDNGKFLLIPQKDEFWTYVIILRNPSIVRRPNSSNIKNVAKETALKNMAEAFPNIHLTPVPEIGIKNLIRSLMSKNSCCNNKMSSKLLKTCIEYISVGAESSIS
jgi:hypothetical protein